MGRMKSLIVLVILALVIKQTVARLFPHETRCYSLNTELSLLPKDSQEAFEHAKWWVETHSRPFSIVNKVIDSWEVVLKDEKCPEKSWQHVVTLKSCLGLKFDFLVKPLRAFAARCLTAKKVSQKLISEASGLLSSGVKFITTEFIQKYHEDNHDEVSLDFWRPLIKVNDNCCRPLRSVGAVIQAIEQNFANKSGNPRDEFRGNRKKLDAYLNRNLFRPCENYKKRMEKIVEELETISIFYEGGYEKLVAALDEEAKNALFRYTYCRQLFFKEIDVVDFAAEKFVKS